MSYLVNPKFKKTNSADCMSTADVFDVQKYGVHEVESLNLTTRQTMKELYKLHYYLYQSKQLLYEPCPICVIRALGATRKCRWCDGLSCHQCFMHRWFTVPIKERIERRGRPTIVDKRCTMCHTQCLICDDVYPRSDKHKCVGLEALEK